MAIIKAILIGVLGLFFTYVFFRLAGLAIAKSWEQVMSSKDCSNEDRNKCKYNINRRKGDERSSNEK